MKISSAGTPISIKDLLTAFLSGGRRENIPHLEEVLMELLKAKHWFLVNSGTTAFYVILKTLLKTENSKPKTEVILPAYTAPSLLLPIKKAGLSYRLVDVSLETFNMDEDKAIQAIDEKTLAVLPVNLFGLPCPIERLTGLRKSMDFYIIEDAASSFGTRYGNELYSGMRGDVGIISFNRGKNLSTIGGGAIITNSDDLAAAIRNEVDILPEPDIRKRLLIYLKGIGLFLAVRPWFYTIFYPMISQLKDTALHEGFESYRYTNFQGSLGLSLIKKAETIFDGRESKGMYLYERLKKLSGIRLPSIPNNWRVVFNQFPMIVEDPVKRDSLLKRIVDAGIEATMLYDKPIHEIFRIKDERQGTSKDNAPSNPPLKIRGGRGSYDDVTRNSSLISVDPFPNATYMSKRLLLIPTHHFIGITDLDKVIEIIHSEFSG